MEENYYITSDGILKRKQNTVYFVNKDVNKPLPVENIRAIFAYGRITYSSGVVAYLCKNRYPYTSTTNTTSTKEASGRARHRYQGTS